MILTPAARSFNGSELPMKRCCIYPVILAVLISAFGNAFAQTGPVLHVGNFSTGSPGEALPKGWEPLTFKKIDQHSRYSLVDDNGTVVVKAESEASSSGMIRKLRFDPKQWPVISWKWKIANIYEKGDVRRKEGDDYPARIYIAFEYDPDKVGFFEKAKYKTAKILYGEYPPLGAINYIWGNRTPTGTITPNPYTEQVMMFVIESGASKADQWVDEERNVYEDYKKAFGEEPPFISGVAIMTDADNTGESAVSYYGDIYFKKSEQ